MLAVVMPCSWRHQQLLPYSIASIELSSIKPVQKVIVTDQFVLNDCVQRKLHSFGWSVEVNLGKSGPAASKNVGLSILNESSEYVTFMDADDVNHPLRFKYCIEALERDNKGVVGSQAVLLPDWGLSDEVHLFGSPRRPKEHDEIVNLNSKGRVHSVFASQVFKLSKTGKFEFKEELLRGEDFALNRDLILKGVQFGNLHQTLYAYNYPVVIGYKSYRNELDSRGNKNLALPKYIRYLMYHIMSSSLSNREKESWKSVIDSVRTRVLAMNLPQITELVNE
jgi:hypothetical protein